MVTELTITSALPTSLSKRAEVQAAQAWLFFRMQRQDRECGMRSELQEGTIMGEAPYGLSAAPREYRLIMLGRAYHYNSYFAFGWHARPPFSVSFTRCPPRPSPATPPTLSRRPCTAQSPLRSNRSTPGQRHHHSWPPQQQRGHPAVSSSKNLKGVTCACVSTGRPIMRPCLCLASADPSRARFSCQNPKASSLSPSAWVSRLSAR